MILIKAKDWRDNNGYNGKGGVVVICEDQVQGWVNALRDPQHWMPGCIAIAEDGTCYKATGGDDQNGAVFWMPCVI